MAKCRHCGAKATHRYGDDKVCERHYKARAAADDAPSTIPANYDWGSEMKKRELPEGK